MMSDQACKSMMAMHSDLFPAGMVPPKPNKPWTGATRSASLAP